MDIFRYSLPILMVFIILEVSGKDPFSSLISYQAKQRGNFGVGDGHYRLLPFRVSGGESQHFLQIPHTNESIYGEIVVHWITSNGSLKFPSFDLSQKVRLIIQEEALSSVLAKPILTKQFLTQTGFKISLIAGRRYRWRVQTSGKECKLVEIALAAKNQGEVNFNQEESKKGLLSNELFKQMAQALERAKAIRSIFQEKGKSLDVSSIWAWMSGFEMFSLLGVILVQVALFQKMSLPTSVV